MSNSSQQKNSCENLDNIPIDSIIDLSGTGCNTSDIIILDNTYDNMSYASSNNYSNITLSTSSLTTGLNYISNDTITITDKDFIFNLPVEWDNCFPSWDKVQDMCEQYPGLKIAFDNFKVFYEMVKDDYDNPTPKK